jgi:hypothetical protein
MTCVVVTALPYPHERVVMKLNGTGDDDTATTPVGSARSSAGAPAEWTRARCYIAPLTEGNNPKTIMHHIGQERRVGHPDRWALGSSVARNAKNTAVLQAPSWGEVLTGRTIDR